MKRFALLATAFIVMQLPAYTLAADNSPPNTPMEKAISALPHDKAETFRDSLQSAHEENEGLYKQEQQLRSQIHDILAADDFNKDAFNTKSQELRQLHDKIRTNLDEAFGDAVSNLSAAERKTLVASLEKQH